MKGRNGAHFQNTSGDYAGGIPVPSPSTATAMGNIQHTPFPNPDQPGTKRCRPPSMSTDFFILSMTRKFSFPLSGVFTLLDKRWSSFGCNHQAVVNNSRRRNQSGTNLDL